MADISPGQPIPRSAALWRNIVDAADDYGQRRRLGLAGGADGSPIDAAVIKIKNAGAAAVRAGEVLEITGFELTDIRRGEMWFTGDEPTGSLPFAVAIQPIPIGKIDRAQVIGACPAIVNVTHADHGFAVTADEESVLQSADAGPVRILYKPSGTGEKLCAVLIGAGGETLGVKMFCDFELDEELGTSDASAEATITAQYGSGADHSETSITVLNLNTDQAGAYLFEGEAGAKGRAGWHEGDEWVILNMQCPPDEEEEE